MSRCQRANKALARQKTLKVGDDRNFLPHINRHGKGSKLSQKSQSLDTIFEEISKEETNDAKEETKGDNRFEPHKPLIPRIKLNTKSRVKTKRNTNRSILMSVKPDSPKSWMEHTNENNTRMVNDEAITKDQSSIITSDEISKKPEENYFTKNFDECMKRLHLLEKEQELMEKDATNLSLFYLPNENKKNTEFEGETFERATSTESIAHSEREMCQHEDVKTGERPEGTLEFEKSPDENCDEKFSENRQKVDSNVDDKESSSACNENDESILDENKELISKWYSNLKQQFERAEEENRKEKTKEMSCRITGATLKNSNEAVKMDNRENDTRHYFSKLVKSNRSLPDEELPDPDIVKNIRAKFQENLNSTLKRRLNHKLGGSLQNISSGKVQSQVWRPLSAQCNRDDVMRKIHENSITDRKVTADSTDHLKDSDKEHSVSRMKIYKKSEKDLKSPKEMRDGKPFTCKWTDSGSVSSGVSSDLSSYDTDFESYYKEEPEPERDDPITISDDDLLDEAKDKHYVQSEILEKIRSFGTSVTYYGGEMITCSVGPLLSPTTQAIMEEITQKYRQEKNIQQTFKDFYGQYFETHDPNRRKKVGRTKSFGQTDVFNRPNTLSNMEIEMYKYDLEVEIGIRKPKGLIQSPTKIKPNVLDSPVDNEDKQEKNDVSETTPNDNTREENLQPTNQPSCPVTIIIEESACDENDLNETAQNETNFPEEGNETSRFVSIEEKSNDEAPQMDFTNLNNSNQKLPFERSQSTPHEIMNGAKDTDEGTNLMKASSTELLFGYDKKLFNDGKAYSDIEFEEFQVCDSAFEKIRRLSEGNPRDEMDSRDENTRLNRKTLSASDAEPERFNIKEDNNSVANKENLEFSINSIQSHYGHNERVGNEFLGIRGKPKKKNNMRWPIETRGVIDIQKNSQSPPLVIVSNGKAPKSPNKSKIRFF